jgi:hypothetical protein
MKLPRPLRLAAATILFVPLMAINYLLLFFGSAFCIFGAGLCEQTKYITGAARWFQTKATEK